MLSVPGCGFYIISVEEETFHIMSYGKEILTVWKDLHHDRHKVRRCYVADSDTVVSGRGIFDGEDTGTDDFERRQMWKTEPSPTEESTLI